MRARDIAGWAGGGVGGKLRHIGVVGGWAQRADGEVVWRSLDPEGLGRDARDAFSAEAARLQAWLGTTRVTPRFRTPLERELSSG